MQEEIQRNIKMNEIKQFNKELRDVRLAFRSIYNDFSEEFNRLQKDANELAQRLFKLTQKADLILETIETISKA